MGKQRKQWSGEQKLEIVMQLLGGHRTAAELSRQYGVHENQIYRWKSDFIDGGKQKLSGRKARTGEHRLEHENEQLKTLLGEKALEIAILKKLNGQ